MAQLVLVSGRASTTHHVLGPPSHHHDVSLQKNMVQVSAHAAPGDCNADTHLLLVFLFSFFLPLFITVEKINHILYLTLPALLFPSEKVCLIVVLEKFCLIIVIIN